MARDVIPEAEALDILNVKNPLMLSFFSCYYYVIVLKFADEVEVNLSAGVTGWHRDCRTLNSSERQNKSLAEKNPQNLICWLKKA
ncbi:hypothetical protein NC653_000079 [Populus alba x Populus x berolinensis]|uniref:Uncharacterized protein n=1 Tax=Populus alba x Populus x berolinensis TaxID=444605 RepID=A0AAD6WE20_9ROSI|nr:hypothetical protein NC653_000079 [Populus alba x Populus x berolinensis]